MRTLEPAPRPTKELDPPVSIVSDYIEPKPGRHLPQMLLATTLVAVLPLASSLALRAAGLISGWASVGLAIAMSLAASTAGNAYWRKRGGHGEVLFGELLLWGWVRSWRQEHELANATRLLDLVNAGSVNAGTAPPGTRDELSVERREQLLVQLAGALEGQDVYLNGHSRRVARHAMMIARGMGLPSEDVARIRAAAAVHDVGKLLTPKAILNKPGRLTDEEFEVIKRHPVDGAEMVAALGDPELTRIVRHHHERLDGAGYPGRLRGEEVPLGARIIAVADTFDAITSARPYRDAAPHQKAIDILRKEAGTQLDPDAVKAFLTYYSGSRPTVIWAIITSSVRRVVAWLSGDPASAATISAGKVAAVTVATASIGAAAAAAPVPVLHHPPLPALGHAVIARPRRVAAGLHREGRLVSLTVPAQASRTVNRTSAHDSSATRSRRAAHAAAARRSPSASQPATARRAHGRTAAARSGASVTARTSTGSATRSATSNSVATVTPGAGTSHSSGAPTTAPPASQPTLASKSQGANANGNAYGPTKLLGGGHGKGVANGHGDANPSSSPSSSGSQPAPASGTVTDPTGAGNQGSAANQGSASNQGGNGGSSHGDGNGNGNQAQQANASAVVVTPSPSPAPTGGQDNGAQDNGGSQGNGNGHGYGHDTSANGG